MSDVAGPDDPGREHGDPRLVDPWGIAMAPRAFAWVANRGTSTSRHYDGEGHAVPRVVTLPPGDAGEARPTAVVHDNAEQFRASDGERTAACTFIVVGASGTVTCWTPAERPLDAAICAFDGAASGAVYTGAAIGRRGGGLVLFAADFHNGRIDAFDQSFTPLATPGGFVDPGLPAGYAPFGIQSVGGMLFVSYAKRDGDRERAGAGRGLIDVFDTDGHLRRRLVPPGGVLNAPWGMARAPGDFGAFSGALLVANAGDGTIAAFGANGSFLGLLRQADGAPLVIDGLRGIAFGRGLTDQAHDAPSLYYTSAPGGRDHGAFGRIDVR